MEPTLKAQPQCTDAHIAQGISDGATASLYYACGVCIPAGRAGKHMSGRPCFCADACAEQQIQGQGQLSLACLILWVLGGARAGGIAAEEAVRAGGVRGDVPQAELAAAGLPARCYMSVSTCCQRWL